MQNYWNLYLACKQQQLYGPLIIGAFEKRAPFLCPSRPRCSLVRSRETRFARPNRIACSQASSIVACSVRVNGLSVRFPNVGLCSIGKILGWVQLSSITEPNRSQSNDLSSSGFDYGTFDKLTTPGNVWLHGDSLERPNWYLLRKIKLLHALHNLL